MASDAQDTLYDIFAGLAQFGGGSVGGGLAGAAVNAASSGGGSSGAGQASKSGGSGSTATTIVKDVLKSGFGVVSLVSALAGLFGGSDGDTPAPLVKYALPAAREFTAAETGAGLTPVDYDQAGMARAFDGGTRASSQPQVQVTVQAMDARSFLDRSTEIAAAVREAMLNLNSINDVVNDL
jgi:hypothetical protein